MPISEIKNKVGYREVFPFPKKNLQDLWPHTPTGAEIQEVISFFKNYGTGVMAQGQMDLVDFRQKAEAIFAKCGYRPQAPGGGVSLSSRTAA